MSKLSTKRGDTWNAVFLWTDDSGAVLDLTDCEARLQVRNKETGVLVLEADTGDISISESEGAVEVTISAERMAAVEPGYYETDLQLTFPGEIVKSTDTIILHVIADITRED